MTRFDLDESFHFDVDKWISFAMPKGLERYSYRRHS
jgi:hypothetical protein